MKNWNHSCKFGTTFFRSKPLNKFRHVCNFQILSILTMTYVPPIEKTHLHTSIFYILPKTIKNLFTWNNTNIIWIILLKKKVQSRTVCRVFTRWKDSGRSSRSGLSNSLGTSKSVIQRSIRSRKNWKSYLRPFWFQK